MEVDAGDTDKYERGPGVGGHGAGVGANLRRQSKKGSNIGTGYVTKKGDYVVQTPDIQTSDREGVATGGSTPTEKTTKTNRMMGELSTCLCERHTHRRLWCSIPGESCWRRRKQPFFSNSMESSEGTSSSQRLTLTFT